jgi:serine/threonine protein kinase
MESAAPREILDFLLANQIVPQSFVQELGSDLSRFQSAAEVTQELVKCGGLTEFQEMRILGGEKENLVFGPYRLVKPLGEGGMGEVFKAWQPRLNRFVALKFVRKEFLDSQIKAESRFRREARAIAGLQHANIVVLHDADELNGIPFIAMEFIDGVSLARLVQDCGPLGVHQACEYMRQSALGLQHAFECGFVHRDIKPSNIVVSRPVRKGSSVNVKKPSLVTIHDRNQMSESNVSWSSHHVKILDMGLARLNDSVAGGAGMITPLTAAGAIIGTPQFMAPEQGSNPSKVDIRADLYSLGCTFYYILAGRSPFAAGNHVELMLKHQLDVPVPLGELRRGVPEAVTRIVERLLAKRPNERFQTPLELVTALTNFLSTTTVQADVPSQANNPTLPTIPNLVMSRPALWASLTGNGSESRRPTADDPRLISPGENPPGLSNTAIPLDHSNQLDSEFASVVMAAKADSTAQMAHDEVTSAARLEGHTGVVSAVAFTPDGSLAVSGDVGGQIRIWDLRNAIPREIRSLRRGAEIQSLAFRLDGSNDVIVGEQRHGRSAVVRWDWRSALLVDWGVSPAPKQKGVGCLGFTADGKILAAAFGALAVTWQICDGEATKRTVYKGLDRPIRALAISPDRLLLAAAGLDRSIHFWDLNRGLWNHNASVRVNCPGVTVTTMSFSPDGSSLALAGLGTQVVLWNMAGDEDQTNRLLRGHSTNVLHVQFACDGRHLVSVGADGQVLVWEIAQGAIIREFRLDLTMAYRVVLSDDATRLIAGYTNGALGIYGFPPLPERSAT